MTLIDFYYDFRSPYAYFATNRMHLLTEQGAEIRWRPAYIDVLLNLQADKEPWAEIVDPLSAPKRAHFMADLFRLIEFWKIPFAMPSPQIPACNQAMAVAALLERDGIKHSAYCDELFRAVWQEQKDGNDSDVIRACLQAGNLNVEILDRAATEGVDLLTQNTVEAYERGVFGVPTFVLGEEIYFGADRLELLASRL